MGPDVNVPAPTRSGCRAGTRGNFGAATLASLAPGGAGDVV